MKKESFAKRLVCLYLPLLVIMVFILFPFYRTFVTSVKPEDELYGAVVTYWPQHITFDAYGKLFTTTVNFMEALKNSLTADVDMVMMPYVAAFDEEGKPTLSYERERIVRRTANFSWVGAVHEVIVPRGNVVHSDVSVFHKKIRPAEAGRNLKIFQKMLADGKTPDERQKFYYARELFDNGLYDAAVTAYSEFLNGDGWVENKICACRDLSACFCKKNMPKQALAALFKSFELDSPRAETCCDLGAFYMQHAMYGRAVFWYKLALNLKPGPYHGRVRFCGLLRIYSRHSVVRLLRQARPITKSAKV